MGAIKTDINDYISYKNYLNRIGDDNGDTYRRLQRNLRRALTDELTPRQRQMIVMYYGEEKNMVEIGKLLNINPSTVSRTLSRGRVRLKRALKYGAKQLLDEEADA